jgi:ketosteroid isomerase-like protein
MNKTLNTVILFFLGQSVIAQKGIDNLIRAEKDFAAYSVAHSTKEAFLNYMDSSSMMFDEGKPVPGIEFWNKREKNSGVLKWRPLYAGIAHSGDFGYTTGPWTFQPSANDTIVARGQFTTVWHINKKGEWKFLVDLGVSNTAVENDTGIHKLAGVKLRHRSEESMLRAEERFIHESKDSARAAYFNNIRGMSILTRNNMSPQLASWEQQTFRENVHYTINGSGIASSGDMGYVYGTTIIDGKTDNYLRIWRREKTGWKIAVEVLRY